MFDELRKRHLLQIALVYLGVGWLFVEITDFIVSNYGFSRKILDTVVLLAILGFPAFLVIGWYHGESGRQRVQRGEMWLLVTLLTLGGIGTYRIVTGEEPEPSTDAPAMAEGVRTAPGESGARAVADDGLPDLGERSLAVLPFRNNLPDEDLDWLGAGLADLLTTNFAQLPEMRVVGRQTLFDLLTEQGRSEEEEIPEALALTVARSAGARMMLWGSVTGSADDMRIDAQLLELEEGTILIAESVRGNDVFALVDSLAVRLVERLRGGPSPAPMVRISQLGTRDMEALGAFQQGIAAERAGRVEEAEVLFERAVTLDSSFVLPLVRLAFREGAEPRTYRFDWRTVDPSELDREDVDLDELARAAADGILSESEMDEIVRSAGLDANERRELERKRVEIDTRTVSVQKERALRALGPMGADLARMEGLSEEEMLAKLDSTLGNALSSVHVWVRDLVRDSTGAPVPPTHDRRPRPIVPDSAS